MKNKRHEIKKPEDLTGKCPDCDIDLAIREGKGYCFCPKCKCEWEFYLKSKKL